MGRCMFECFGSAGKIRRVGVASVIRVLNDLGNITAEGESIWATVCCPDAGVYIVREAKEYTVSWFEGDVLQETDLTRKKAISKFLELRQEAIKCSA